MSTSNQTCGFIRERQLLQRVPVAHSTLWKWVGEGRFPAPLKLSERVTVWRLADIEAWEKQQGGGGSRAENGFGSTGM